MELQLELESDTGDGFDEVFLELLRPREDVEGVDVVVCEDICDEELRPVGELCEEDINDEVVDWALDLGDECAAVVVLFETA